VAALTVLDLMTFSQVLALLGLWPLLLIFAGIQLILGRHSPWIGAALAVLLVAVALTLTFAGDRLGIRLGAPTFIIGDWEGDWGDQERVRGNGEVAEETYEVSNFNEVMLELPGQLEIVQGASESLTIRAESNLLEYIDVQDSGNKLEIDNKRGFALDPTRDIVFLLTVEELDSVSVSSAGEVTIEELDTDQLVLSSSGVGNFNLADLQAERLISRSAGSVPPKSPGGKQLFVDISGAGALMALTCILRRLR
jgi:hypothetical protein